MNWRDVYEEQMDLWRWTESERGQFVLRAWSEIRKEDQPTLAATYAALVKMEPHKLSAADPIFISGEMCEVIEHARHGFAPEPFISEDLLVPQAYVRLQEPIIVNDRHNQPISIAAFAWCPLEAIGTEGDPHGKSETPPLHGIALSIYTDTPMMLSREMAGLKVSLLHVVPIWFGLSFEGEETDVDDGKETGSREWWTTVQTCLRLMQQHIAVRHQERPPRPSLRRAKRAAFPELDVIVVRLRRDKNDPHPDHEPGRASYSYRFIRNGHWRNQWYGTLKAHRQIWIAPTIVGDEHLPLVVKRRAFNWDR